jgi:hypothetical protein
METNNEMKWVDARLALLEPAWRADGARGGELLEAELRRRAPFRVWVPAAAAVAVCIAVALPQTRAVAEQLWNHVFLNRVEVVRVDFSALPLDSHVTMGGITEARDVDDAERLAGFRPFVPVSESLSGKPSLAVMERLEIGQTVHVDQLRAALRKARAGEVSVPAEWEGAQFRYSVGPTVVLEYAGGIEISETKPIEFSIPGGFPLQRLAEVAFRCMGVSEREAGEMARKFSANPSMLLDAPASSTADVEQVVLRSGPAVLIQEFRQDGSVDRVTVIRTTGDRIYSVETKSRAQAFEIGDALP